MFHIQIGPFMVRGAKDGDAAGHRIAVQAVTPWFDVENRFELDRSKSIHLCVVCNELSNACECGELQVLVNPETVKDHLIALDHELYHHMTRTECEEEEHD